MDDARAPDVDANVALVIAIDVSPSANPRYARLLEIGDADHGTEGPSSIAQPNCSARSLAA
jgi:hypothetical protein